MEKYEIGRKVFLRKDSKHYEPDSPFQIPKEGGIITENDSSPYRKEYNYVVKFEKTNGSIFSNNYRHEDLELAPNNNNNEIAYEVY